MNFLVFIQIASGVAGLLVILGLVYAFRCKPGKEFQQLMPETNEQNSGKRSRRLTEEELEIERIKRVSGYAKEEIKKQTVSAKLYKAGYYGVEHRKKFLYFQITSIICWPILIGLGVRSFISSDFLAFSMVLLGLGIGYIMPLAWVDRKIRLREEDTLYYLPLVIEQIAIGVSGSLDIGPCIAQIINTAHERDSHNPVTEMFVHVEKLVRSGLSLEDSLIEVAEVNGMNEIKHAFMFLVQCAKHGGEVSKQLQELADSVMVQRQVQVEGQITALPVKATGPLAAVFAGFFGLLFAGLFATLANAFG